MSAKKSYPKSEVTRSTLIRAAEQLFIHKGYHSTSIRDIAEGANLAPGGIYNHFPDKEAIFEAILYERNPLVHMMKTVHVLPDVDGSEHDYIRSVVRQFVAAYEDNPHLLNLVLIEVVEFNARHIPRLFETLLPMIDDITGRIITHEPKLRVKEPLLLFRSMLGVVFSYFITARLLAQPELTTEDTGTLEDCIDLYLRGVLED